MIRKIISLMLSVCLIFTVAGCSGSSEKGDSSSAPNASAQENQGFTLRLLYCANDTLNPYKTVSKLNAELSSLMFDPLVKFDNSFNSVKVLAENITSEANLCTVSLKNTTFSDGSPLTAEDVIFSYNLAKESDRYSSLLYEVEKVEATEDGKILFTLNKNDPYFYRLLSFPILKNGSDQLKNEDNVELVPIGTGAFIFSPTETALNPNPKYHGEKSNVLKITLINAPDDESMEHYVEVGATDIYYADGGDENIIRMSGQKTYVHLNNLVYLGINHYYAPLKSDEVRHIISSAISRATLVSEAFYTNAVAANGFFHPYFEDTKGYQTLSDSANLKICVENLNDIGYNRLNEEGFYENESGNPLEFTLLVNSDSFNKVAAANLIKKQLGEVGIKITVNALPYESFLSALENGHFQLYLGEIKLQQNMDITSLVLSGGAAAYGMPEAIPENKTEQKDEQDSEDQEQTEEVPLFDGETAYISIVEGYYEGTNSLTDIASSLLSSMPVIPLVYRNNVIFYSDGIDTIGEVSCYDIFFSVDEYKAKK